MSLEGYKKIIASQREREEGYTTDRVRPVFSAEESGPSAPAYSSTKPTSHKKHLGWFLTLMLILTLLVVSAIKNPSESDSRDMVKNFIVEKVNDALREQMTDKDSDGLTAFVSLLGMAFMPNLLDYACEIKVTDYILLTTFDCTTPIAESENCIVSGVIIFGKIIPLHSDFGNHIDELMDSKNKDMKHN